MTDFKAYLSKRSKLVEKNLKKFLPREDSLLIRAMEYSLMAGGKRLRPVLALEAARLCGGSDSDIMPAACALEYIHTYSLIHDDLPAMDNDDLRRGKPTSHRKFGEAAAILAGDALLTEAFALLITSRADSSAKTRAVGILASKAGARGMVKGQSLDTLEGGKWNNKNKKVLAKRLNLIHLNKTAALIEASLCVGAVLAGASDNQMKALETYGRNIGLAFQITDDILDIVGNKKLLGKKGSDRENGKLTYPALYGLDKSYVMARNNIFKAKSSLKIFGRRTAFLESLADYILRREH
ncbi:MAG TPA: polyprenyl synthetase [Elusimicrobia bacterium]|nr:MAG: hypothetical protein A2278_00655 [Elusimicrobia bacterium RIFOXYA12_FULL_49_49]OGS10998.1 MAG: hypothetical protein A2386_00250 [Elusimicrobia bacterium RIFOXYB1_FULL_48_9]OGS15166.1 MAG: hypothetical protein A2251_00665 [Elusimicrobia bacterium RIFOXYA2_FULL_47_53]OGS29786.1 MAG: hypothetical protein A2323_01465 [Elusimicrobia bacterium RIFOXYB2_FULL_46_23]HBU70269.1 polyprenyl synthetase [Elusimicrobiota bacterium]